MSPYAYINAIFRAAAAIKGGIVRRSIADVDKFASHRYLVEEVKRRGFHMFESGDQYIIVCNSGVLKLIL